MGYRKIAVDNKTYIAPLQMYGPIINPINVTDETTIELVKKGYTVRQKMKDGTFFRLNRYNMKDPEQAKAMLNDDTTPAPKTPEKKKEAPQVKEEIPAPAPVTPPVKVYDDGPKDFGQEVESIDTSIPQVEETIPEVVDNIDNYNNDNFEAVVVNSVEAEPEVEEDAESTEETDEADVEDSTVEANPTEQQANRKKKKKRR